jgi:hypothetical protein
MTVVHVLEGLVTGAGDVLVSAGGIEEVVFSEAPTVVKLPVAHALVRLIARERTRQ